MATWQGNQGNVTVEGTAVGELKMWDLTRRSGVVETTAAGNTWRTRKAGLKEESGSFTAHFDRADTAQAAVTIGSVVTLVLSFDDGTDSFSGEALILEEVYSSDINDQITEASYRFVNADNTGIAQA